MSYQTVLMNFRVPVGLKLEFEDACRRLHLPMTAQVNILIREFLEKQDQKPDEPLGILFGEDASL